MILLAARQLETTSKSTQGISRSRHFGRVSAVAIPSSVTSSDVEARLQQNSARRMVGVHLSKWVASKTLKHVPLSFRTQNLNHWKRAANAKFCATYSSWTVQRSQWQEARTKLNSTRDQVVLGWFTWLTQQAWQAVWWSNWSKLPEEYGLWKASAESELWSRRRLWCGDFSSLLRQWITTQVGDFWRIKRFHCQNRTPD